MKGERSPRDGMVHTLRDGSSAGKATGFYRVAVCLNASTIRRSAGRNATVLDLDS